MKTTMLPAVFALSQNRSTGVERRANKKRKMEVF